jgi:KDEL-tailed cysteine endopeptidase
MTTDEARDGFSCERIVTGGKRYVNAKKEEEYGEDEPLASVDCRTKDCLGHPCVTKVKFQGRCGACWAFAAAGAVESLNVIKGTSVPMDLSPQELVVQGMEGNLSGPQHSPRPVHRRLRAGAVLPQRPTDVRLQ